MCETPSSYYNEQMSHPHINSMYMPPFYEPDRETQRSEAEPLQRSIYKCDCGKCNFKRFSIRQQPHSS